MSDQIPQNVWGADGRLAIPPMVLQQLMAAQLAAAKPPPRMGPVMPGTSGPTTSPIGEAPRNNMPPPATSGGQPGGLGGGFGAGLGGAFGGLPVMRSPMGGLPMGGAFGGDLGSLSGLGMGMAGAAMGSRRRPSGLLGLLNQS